MSTEYFYAQPCHMTWVACDITSKQCKSVLQKTKSQNLKRHSDIAMTPLISYIMHTGNIITLLSTDNITWKNLYTLCRRRITMDPIHDYRQYKNSWMSVSVRPRQSLKPKEKKLQDKRLVIVILGHAVHVICSCWNVVDEHNINYIILTNLQSSWKLLQTCSNMTSK